jgi:hypothetical protein
MRGWWASTLCFEKCAAVGWSEGGLEVFFVTAHITTHIPSIITSSITSITKFFLNKIIPHALVYMDDIYYPRTHRESRLCTRRAL